MFPSDEDTQPTQLVAYDSPTQLDEPMELVVVKKGKRDIIKLPTPDKRVKFFDTRDPDVREHSHEDRPRTETKKGRIATYYPDLEVGYVDYRTDAERALENSALNRRIEAQEREKAEIEELYRGIETSSSSRKRSNPVDAIVEDLVNDPEVVEAAIASLSPEEVQQIERIEKSVTRPRRNWLLGFSQTPTDEPVDLFAGITPEKMRKTKKPFKHLPDSSERQIPNTIPVQSTIRQFYQMTPHDRMMQDLRYFKANRDNEYNQWYKEEGYKIKRDAAYYRQKAMEKAQQAAVRAFHDRKQQQASAQKQLEDIVGGAVALSEDRARNRAKGMTRKAWEKKLEWIGFNKTGRPPSDFNWWIKTQRQYRQIMKEKAFKQYLKQTGNQPWSQDKYGDIRFLRWLKDRKIDINPGYQVALTPVDVHNFLAHPNVVVNDPDPLGLYHYSPPSFYYK